MGRRLEFEKSFAIGRKIDCRQQAANEASAMAMDELEMKWDHPEFHKLSREASGILELRLAYHAELLLLAERIIRDVEKWISHDTHYEPDWFDPLVLRVRAHRRERK